MSLLLRRSAALFVVSAVLLGVLGLDGTPARAFNPASTPETKSTLRRVASAERQVLHLVNTARKRKGLRPVHRSKKVNPVATRWTRQMAQRGKLAHNPGYAQQLRLRWTRAAENVGYTSRKGASVRWLARRVHRALMDSPGHRHNILGDYNRIGLGVFLDSDGVLWITQNFAKAA